EEDEGESSTDQVRVIGLVLAFLAIVVLVVLLCGMKTKKKSIPMQEPPKLEPEEAPPAPEDLPDAGMKVKKKKTAKCKSWMRRSCRPILLHNEASLRKYKENAEKEVAVHTERTQRQIAVWTKARERDAQKKRDRLERKASRI
ncbi:uncharacterized protein LOC108098375, partial [Drosophila ficusphila]|uniref:uncharacterized protein LOC108098375 n=1 Tax=Drosophila ficusphila TaxID=30025 RepID=UPI001C8A2928